jgi:uncharacterized protein (TIGR04255 family)
VLQAVDAARSIIDSDFFTRIGLRYINVIDSGDEEVTDWINPSLVAPITSELFTGISDFGGRMQLLASDGGCLFQHGIQLNQTKPELSPKVEYLIDIDTFRSEVSLENVASAIDVMHQQAFDLFDWAIGEKARDFLSTVTKHHNG